VSQRFEPILKLLHLAETHRPFEAPFLRQGKQGKEKWLCHSPGC